MSDKLKACRTMRSRSLIENDVATRHSVGFVKDDYHAWDRFVLLAEILLDIRDLLNRRAPRRTA